MVFVEEQSLVSITHRCGYYGPGYFLIVPDHAAGKRRRFTLYHIPTSPSRRVRILGRELTLGYCQQLARRHKSARTKK
jgi:hypothetical protein